MIRLPLLCSLALGLVFAACSSEDGGSGGNSGSGGSSTGGTGTGGTSTGGTSTGGAGTGGTSTGGTSSGGTGGIIGTPNPALTNLGDGESKDLGAFTCTDPGEGEGVCRRATDYSGFVFDSRNHQFLMFGGGHSTTMTDSIFAFDLEDTLTWKELYEPTPCDSMITSNLDEENGAWLSGAGGPFPRPLSVHTYDMLGFAPTQNEFVLISRLFTGGYCNTVGNDIGGPVAHYNLDGNAWSFTTAEIAHSSNIDATEYDPIADKIVMFGGSGLGVYDPATRNFDLVVSTYDGETLKTPGGADADMGNLGYANHMTYFPPTDTFYYFVRGEADPYALKLDRNNLAASTLDHVSTTGTASPHGEPGWAYDDKNQVIGGGIIDSTIYIFNPANSTWSAVPIPGDPGSEAFHAIGYDPTNNVFIFVTDYDGGSKTWAFRYKK
jgi:hypothetical protein